MGRATRGRRTLLTSIVLLSVLALVLGPRSTFARPSPSLSRQKRVSDQRLAELETLLALQKLKGRLVTVPIAFGVLNPDKIGRRRRSSTDEGLRKLQRVLRFVEENPSFLEEDNDILSAAWKNSEDGRHENGGYPLI
ncbi:hypothetical protein KM043_001450 [Ampulex compressa]|nr:hypothetical protein KM043_001450 [Ampulex compressa]